ncbi:MAG: monofunctional biosynthetic peptidoglycan transglycosylase [Muribaculaceae bacterium]|nr:monofunctional biosynthetic peptidoglycan transglycosylase [Muribaculaceae bacterium]
MKFIKRWVRNTLIFFFVSTIGAVVAFKYMPVYFTPLMIIRCAEQATRGEVPHIDHKWVPLSEISHNAPQAVMASEDNLFLDHNGFDFKEILKAQAEAQGGGRVRGASTISQQTAKNVFLWPGNSTASKWVRKGFEVYFTVLIEKIWGKERIMEVYLNSIEMGDGIYGIEAVSVINFHSRASNITAKQAALVAATLPDPLHRDSGHPTPWLNKRSKQIVDLMGKVKTFPHVTSESTGAK